jgi:transcriptional regulator with XRE-family HTH domain
MSQPPRQNDIALQEDLRLGNDLRARRKAKGLSLREVAERAALSPGLVSQIERGFTSPTVRSLRQLCAALETPLEWLFEQQPETTLEEEGIVMRRHRRRAHDLRSIGMVRELLTFDSSPNLQLLIVSLQPGGERLDKTKLQEGDEAGLVLAGTIKLEVDGREFVLDKGDSFSIPKGTPYNFINIGEDTAEILWACTPALY